MTKIDADKGNSGVLTKEEFKAALQEYFPQRSEEDIDKACVAAEHDLEARDSDTLDYKSLFMEVRKASIVQCNNFFLNVFLLRSDILFSDIQ